MAKQTERVDITDDLHIYKQADSKRWIAKFKIGKTWLAKTTKEKDQQAATVKAIQLQSEYRIKADNNLPLFTKKAKTNTFEVIANDAIKRMDTEIEEGVGKVVYADYKQALNNYHIPYFTNAGIGEIKAKELMEFDSWRVNQLGRNPSKSTINTHNAALQRVFDEAVISNLITHTELPKLKNTGESGNRRAAFTAEQMKIILNENDGWFGSGKKQISIDTKMLLFWYVKFALNTGIRPGTEIEQLTWGDVHKRKIKGAMYTTVTVRKGKTTKHTGTREIVLKADAELALDVLKKINKHTDDDDLIFVLPNGSQSKELSRNFTARLRKLGMYETEHGKHTLYSLRHTYITNQILDNVPMHVIATQCGTSEKMIEEHYKHVKPLMFAKEIVNLDSDLERLVESIEVN